MCADIAHASTTQVAEHHFEHGAIGRERKKRTGWIEIALPSRRLTRRKVLDGRECLSTSGGWGSFRRLNWLAG